VESSQAEAKPVENPSVLKKEKKEKKIELKEKKQKIHALKKEAKKCRKELKSLKKACKQAQKQEKKKISPNSKVVAHLETDEKSTQLPGALVLKTWKVLNTGKCVWNDGEVTAEFVKGDAALVVEGFEVMQVESTKMNGAAFINCMLQVPTIPGRYVVVYKLAYNGKRFGEKLRTVIFVKEPEQKPVVPEEEEEDRGVIEDFEEEEIPYVEERKEDVQEEIPAPQVIDEPVPAEPVLEAFAFADQLANLVGMGFQEDTSKTALVATNGDMPQALELLLQA